jgi:hypothetical protein
MTESTIFEIIKELRIPDLSERRLETLAFHPSETVRYYVASHQNTPRRVLERLMKDNDEDIASRAQKALHARLNISHMDPKRGPGMHI